MNDFGQDFRKLLDAQRRPEMTLDVRLREDAREMLWRLRTGDGLSPEQRKNIQIAMDDLAYVLTTDARRRDAELAQIAMRAAG